MKSPISVRYKNRTTACLFYLLRVLSDEKESELAGCPVQYDGQELSLQPFLYNQRKAQDRVSLIYRFLN